MSSGGGKRKQRHEEHEEHVNHERWLVSYADMLTLLFVLFVVLYSMSSVDNKKFAELAAGLSAGFGAQSVAFSGQTSTLDGAGQSTEVVAIDPGANPGDGKAGSSNLTAKQQEAVKAAMAAEDRSKASKNAQAATKEAENLKKIENQISDVLAAQKLLGSVKFTIDRRGLVVTVLTNDVVFAGNRAELKSGGKKILDAIAPTLKKLPNNIEVDGNTNQLKVQTSYYPSGWELSAARASTTVRYLVGKGLAKNRMTAVGYSDTKPLIDPADPRSITMNRRVDIVVLTTLTADQAALLPAASGSDSKLHTGQTSAQAAKAAQQSSTTTESTTESSTSTATTTAHN
ncbi:flagellar motor protein MotB [Paractinoplanes atraurantiacus]|uniref:Chemotaxis protein MotB n=1 Tax=Paractinoplanes atraurantiacus TaxID=1036182 RepID=A0A285F1A9_9ACTN|nr:flagellar motor protein MotB [Actinoplanes atraurantiacus]SNY05075.1 chemotaxis protein MotB [Actinoplanes atraurantiacus]